MSNLFICAVLLPGSVHAFHAISNLPLKSGGASIICSGRLLRTKPFTRIQALEGSEQSSKKAEALKLAESARRALMEAEAAERKVIHKGLTSESSDTSMVLERF